MLNEKIRKRYSLKKEILELLETESKRVLKTETELLEDLIYKQLHERDNRLSNHIARDTENLMYMFLMKKDKEYSSIEEIQKEANVINNDKKDYLKERKDRSTSQYKELLKENKTIKKENEEIGKELKNKFKEILSCRNQASLDNIYSSLNNILKKYKVAKEVPNE